MTWFNIKRLQTSEQIEDKTTIVYMPIYIFFVKCRLYLMNAFVMSLSNHLIHFNHKTIPQSFIFQFLPLQSVEFMLTQSPWILLLCNHMICTDSTLGLTHLKGQCNVSTCRSLNGSKITYTRGQYPITRTYWGLEFSISFNLAMSLENINGWSSVNCHSYMEPKKCKYGPLIWIIIVSDNCLSPVRDEGFELMLSYCQFNPREHTVVTIKYCANTKITVIW